MGEEWALPGAAIFQRMLLVSLQRTGGLARGATPLANGPRHWGQESGGAVEALMAAFSARTDKVDSQAETRIRHRGYVMRRDCAPVIRSLSKRAWQVAERLCSDPVIC